MKNLQSKEMPFRTTAQFYQPSGKERNNQSIKVFPNRHRDTTQTLTPAGELPSVYKYLSGLNQAKHLPRCVGNKHEYYPVVKNCKRLRHRIAMQQQKYLQNVEEQTESKKSRFQTLVSNSPTNRSIMLLQQINHQQKRIDGDRKQFRFTRSVLKEEKEKQMRFSFYNTVEKSQFFLKRFKEDSFIEERKTNNYQNIMKRTITAENILSVLRKSKEKYRMGL